MKRLAIVGTAETWRDAPYDDPTWKIASLNDAYRLGIKKADYWYDFHRPEEWLLVPDGQTVVKAWEMPAGKFYPRPHDHPNVLASMLIPVYVAEARPEWPTSITFPRDAIEQAFGRYMASSPAWMLAHAMLPEADGGLGYVAGDEIGIYGIHLATEREYIEQRPNMEWLIGVAETRGITISLPDECPLKKSRWTYAFEHRPDFGVSALGREVQAAEKEQRRITNWLLSDQAEPIEFPTPVPLWVKADPKSRLQYAAAVAAEASGRMQAARLRELGLAV